MSDKITLIIADDHPIVRQGFRMIIERDETLDIVAELENGAAALEAIRHFRPQIAILDIDMPELDGFEVARAVANEKLPAAVIFLTIHHTEETFNAAIDAGAMGFLLKDSPPKEILKCIRTVAEGEFYVTSNLAGYLLKRSRRREKKNELPAFFEALTPTELRILRMVAADKTTKQIAEELFVSPRTVETHRSNICEKLDLTGNNALLKFAMSHRSELIIPK